MLISKSANYCSTDHTNFIYMRLFFFKEHWDRETAAGMYNTDTLQKIKINVCALYVCTVVAKKKSIYIGHRCMCICLKWADKRKDKVQKNKIKVKITLYHPHHRGKTEAPSGVSWVGPASHWVVFSWHPDSQENPQIVDKTAVEKLCFVQKHLQSLLRWTTTCPATGQVAHEFIVTSTVL